MYDKVIMIGVTALVAAGAAIFFFYMEKEKEKPQTSRPHAKSALKKRGSHSPPFSYDDVKPKDCSSRKKASAHEPGPSTTSCKSAPNPSLQASADTNSLIQESVDQNSLIQDSVDPNSSIQGVVDPNSSIQKSVDPNSSIQESVDPNSGVKKIADPNSGSQKIADPSLASQESENHNSSQERADEKSPLSPPLETTSEPCHVCEEPADVTLHPCKHKVFCSEHAEYYINVAKRYSRKSKCPECRNEIESFTY